MNDPHAADEVKSVGRPRAFKKEDVEKAYGEKDWGSLSAVKISAEIAKKLGYPNTKHSSTWSKSQEFCASFSVITFAGIRCQL